MGNILGSITLTAPFWSSQNGCINDTPATSTFPLPCDSKPPFSAVYRREGSECGGRWTVYVVDGAGRRVDTFVTCFNGVNCSMVGKQPVGISYSLGRCDCRVDCPSDPDGSCTIDGSLIDRLLQLIKK